MTQKKKKKGTSPQRLAILTWKQTAPVLVQPMHAARDNDSPRATTYVAAGAPHDLVNPHAEKLISPARRRRDRETNRKKERERGGRGSSVFES